MIKIILITVSLTTLLMAKYTNCTFQNKNYSDICEKAVEGGVTYKYANQFLLSYFKTKKYDEVSWKYLQPREIKKHRASEKKANNALVKYVPQIVKNLKEYKEVYDYAEKKYGVNREIIAAILLKETRLGKIKPKHDAFGVFNTIVTRVKTETSREKWLMKMGKTNMTAIIKYCYKKGVVPEQCNIPSSYAGAVGIPQFMPNSFIHAKSYKSEISDLTKMEDAIVSAANFLHKNAKFKTLIKWENMPDIPKIEDEWYKYEASHKESSFVYEKSKRGKVYNCFSKDKPELGYLSGYVKKIMRYNNSSNYSVGVLRLAYDANLALMHKN
ncbi:lytic murein transglycosylase [Sulfurimonas sp.]|jgi:membrane-bound lytic murein transglycosylase B|uniref:lytic murein transglycosylase n=1 Tax=Sulfurimonas sp. TaxID=2022749 RepID=UPI0025F8D0C8|nr:lytic murein transglycosylase [Sulfurimonas sp.]MBT5935876.1 murein transglycosylase [Sulfurimonas sp.]